MDFFTTPTTPEQAFLQYLSLAFGLALFFLGITLTIIFITRLRRRTLLQPLHKEKDLLLAATPLRERLFQDKLLMGAIASLLLGATLSVALLRLYDTAFKPVLLRVFEILFGCLGLIVMLLGYRTIVYVYTVAEDSQKDAHEKRLMFFVIGAMFFCGFLCLCCYVLAH